MLGGDHAVLEVMVWHPSTAVSWSLVEEVRTISPYPEISVNGGRKLTPLRRLKVDPLGFLVLFGDGRGDAAEVSVLQPVGVALQGDDLGVVDEPVDHGGGDGVVAEDLAPAGEVLVAR